MYAFVKPSAVFSISPYTNSGLPHEEAISHKNFEENIFKKV